jgi:hypothetical protein
VKPEPRYDFSLLNLNSEDHSDLMKEALIAQINMDSADGSHRLGMQAADSTLAMPANYLTDVALDVGKHGSSVSAALYDQIQKVHNLARCKN